MIAELDDPAFQDDDLAREWARRFKKGDEHTSAPQDARRQSQIDVVPDAAYPRSNAGPYFATQMGVPQAGPG